MALLGNQVGPHLCAALGLPKTTRAFTLRAEVGQIVTVECEYYVINDTGIASALTTYELVERAHHAPRPEAELMHFDEWMRRRTQAAHEEFMHRTSQHLPGDWRTFPPEEIERYFSALTNGDADG